MFKIFDGRSHFFQWDKERKLIVEDKSINQVHFCNRTGECSLIREVYELDGLRVVDVPEVILTEAWRIHVYGYDINHTKYEEVFEVKQRTRPDDYVYGEEELRSWDELIQKVEQIEREGFTDEQVEKAVSDFLEKNPIDMEGYVSDEELEEAIEAIPQPDLSGYALKSEIPSTSGLATEKFVKDEIAKIDIPEADLSNYYTKKQVDDSINTVYSTMDSLQDDYAPKNDTYTKDEVDNAIEVAIGNIDIPEGGNVDLSNYYTKSEVDTKFENLDIPEADVDLSGYYTKDEVDTKFDNLDIPEAAEEVYVGAEEPDDVNIKIWINPEEETEKFTTEADVIALIEQYGGGGGEVLPSAEGVGF